MKKKTITTIATLATAAVILISSYISKNENDISPQSTTAESSVTQSSVTQSSSVQKPTFPNTIVKIGQEGIVPFGYIQAKVTTVTDGDTFHIEYDKQDYKVRMLDIDTPESVKAGIEPQPYAAKASELTKKILTGKQVKLVFEKGIRDQFGRLLAHVILEDDTYYNALMVQNGYAIAVFYSPNILLKDYFFDLQNSAIEKENGFWQLPENKRPFIEDSKGKFIAAYKLKDKAS